MALWTMKAVEEIIAIMSVARSQLSFSGSSKGESPRFQTFPLKRFQSENYALRKIVSKAGFYLSHCTGMSWYVPSGSRLRIVIGKTPASSSFIAKSTDVVIPSGTSINKGAPIEI